MATARYVPIPLKRRAPPHRHAAPSAPWPWIDIHDEVDPDQLRTERKPIPDFCHHDYCECWKEYPQSRFPNWTILQRRRSGIDVAIHDYDRSSPCYIHYVNVDTDGFFTDADKHIVREEDVDRFWMETCRESRPDNLRVRALFIENMSGPILQMLGAKFNIEPFFFSSSLSWIPSCFQEEVRKDKGDHITITLSFLRTIKGVKVFDDTPSASSTEFEDSNDDHIAGQIINTQAPLQIGEDTLCLDFLAVHLIRSNDGLGSTIISYHCDDLHSTSAPYLRERIQFAGQSVYWQSIFQKSPDVTFVLLVFIWHAVYAWDEALEKLFGHVCWMESQIIKDQGITNSNAHLIQAHLLDYASMLENLRRSIMFILDTPNPAMNSIDEKEKAWSRNLLERECKNLTLEVERLEKLRLMQERRLANVMNLVFSTVNILDSKRMQDLTEAAVRDSAAMRQIAYLSMIFLPAGFVAGVFGMNVKELNGSLATFTLYFSVALPLTALTIWIVIAFNSKYLFRGKDATFWVRLAWPVLLVQTLLSDTTKKKKGDIMQMGALQRWNTDQRRMENASLDYP